MYLIVNGYVKLNGQGFYRIDDVDKEAVGLNFLMNPYALITDEEQARKFVEMVNSTAKLEEEKPK